jgi:uncharacterized protein (DUF1697 family)
MTAGKKSIAYAALLRGISPTNPNMKNENLIRVFEDSGFQNVRTVFPAVL